MKNVIFNPENKDVANQFNSDRLRIGDICRITATMRGTHGSEYYVIAGMPGVYPKRWFEEVLPTKPLSFCELREANIKRLPQFKNSKGEDAHRLEDGSDWSPAQWLQAIIGELGEYANKRKKFERGDINWKEFKAEAEKELADVQVYLDILAFQLGIDLGEATVKKFNEVSNRVGSDVKL